MRQAGRAHDDFYVNVFYDYLSPKEFRIEECFAQKALPLYRSQSSFKPVASQRLSYSHSHITFSSSHYVHQLQNANFGLYSIMVKIIVCSVEVT